MVKSVKHASRRNVDKKTLSDDVSQRKLHKKKVKTFKPKSKAQNNVKPKKNQFIVSHKKSVKSKLSPKDIDSNEEYEESDECSLDGDNFTGDISEQDINSDDDLSLDEKELPTPPDVTSSEDEESEEEDELQPEVNNKVEIVSDRDEKESRTIFVGNLPKTIKNDKLKKWFAKYGVVESVRLRCAPLSDPGIPKKVAIIKQAFHEERNSINGFVRFSTIEEAKNALAENGQQFDETHHLRVDMASVKGKSKRYDDKKAVFVGNLHFSAEEDHLRDHFADCGDITSIRIVRDKHTSVGKGFAFINFGARHSVPLALQRNGVELNGRKLRVQKAVYNQDSPIGIEQKKQKFPYQKKDQWPNKNRNYNSNSTTKFKKKKFDRTKDTRQFQGLSSNKDLKVKKKNKHKRKVDKKKEVLKKVLNTRKNPK